MTGPNLVVGISLALSIAGCCDQSVQARAFIGHKTEAECRRLMNTQEPPVSIICPGTEVTICWTSDAVEEVEIAVSPDDESDSGTYGTSGAIHLTPSQNTTVDIVASDCASATKQIQVVNGPTPATFDGQWNASCSQITYRLDPAFVDPQIQTIDVTAQWEPLVSAADGSTFTCPTPPFLDGSHPIEAHGFEIERPFITHAFSRILKAIEDWNYQLKTCTNVGFKCNPFANMPFAMTLVCPAR